MRGKTNAFYSNADNGFMIAGSDAVKTVQLIVDNDNLNKKNEVEEGQYWPLVGLTLGSFLQVIAMDQQTCHLEICHNDGKRGRFIFIQGSLYDAQCGELEGEEAAMELVSWEGVRFIVKKIPEDVEIPRRIHKSLISLLMESTRLRDETGRDPSAGPEENEEIPNSVDAEGAALAEREGPGEPAPDLRADFQQCVDKLKAAIGEALTHSAIFDCSSGDVMAGYAIKLGALDYYFEMLGIFENLRGRLSEPGQYFFTNIEGNQVLVFVLVKNIRWAVEFDSRQMKLGLFLNALIPKLVGACEAVLKKHAQADTEII
jgi:hypothetical protein